VVEKQKKLFQAGHLRFNAYFFQEVGFLEKARA